MPIDTDAAAATVLLPGQQQQGLAPGSLKLTTSDFLKYNPDGEVKVKSISLKVKATPFLDLGWDARELAGRRRSWPLTPRPQLVHSAAD